MRGGRGNFLFLLKPLHLNQSQAGKIGMLHCNLVKLNMEITKDRNVLRFWDHTGNSFSGMLTY